MKVARSGSRGVYWRANPRGTQELRARGRSRQRGDWWIRWACPHGHLHREQVGPKSLAQQEAERHRLEKPCPRHTPKPATYLLSDVIREHVDSAKAVKRSWKNEERYGKVWSERFGGRTLDEITTAELDKLRAERLGSLARRRVRKDEKRPVTAGTVNREFAFLRHVYNVAIRDGKIERNPVAKLRPLREPSGRVRYLSDDEEVNLMGALSEEEDRQRVTFLLHTGLRKAEFLGLRWRDLDGKAGVLTIPRSKHGETRHVPINGVVRDILSRRPRPLDRSSLVFPNGEGKRDLRWAEKTLPKAVGDAKIDDFRPHDLRHTFASRLAMAGVDLLTIKELGGWKTLTMVQRYAHLSPSHRREAIERLAARKPAQESARSAGAESHRD